MGWKNALIGIIAAACLTKLDMKSAACWAACRQEGYDSGTIEKTGKWCMCVRKISFEEMTGTTKVLDFPETVKKPRYYYRGEND